MKFSTSPAIAAISRIWIARLARTVGNPRRGLQRRLRQIVQDQRALARIGAEEHVVDLGRFLRLHRHVGGHALLGIGWRAGRRGGDCGTRDFARERHPAAFLRCDQPELLQHWDGRLRIDRKLRLDGSARRVVDLVDQPRGKLDELPLLVLAVGGRLDIQVGQHPQQRRTNIDALATGECHQPVESGKQRLGHGGVRDSEETVASAYQRFL